MFLCLLATYAANCLLLCSNPCPIFGGGNALVATAKILNLSRKVLIPDPEAGCSLADSCHGDKFERFVAAHPDRMVVTYVNTIVAVKTFSDIACTSSNAVKSIELLPVDEKKIRARQQSR